jgi:hypothetical protein
VEAVVVPTITRSVSRCVNNSWKNQDSQNASLWTAVMQIPTKIIICSG